MEKKHLTKEAALLKLQRYCAYQERCHQEVRTKLIELGTYGSDREQIIASLIEDNFLNEERYARSYARGKFRMKQWGRQRIVRELKMRGVSDYSIRKGLTEIDETEYLDTLAEVLKKREGKISWANDFDRKNQLAQYAMKRGFESELTWEMLKSV